MSRVLNRRSGVAAATREAVERAMRDIGVSRPISGQLIAIVTPNLSTPFFAHLAERIEAELAPYGLRTLITAVRSGTVHEWDYVNVLVNAGVSAVIFLAAGNTLRYTEKSPAELLTSRGVPFVTINGGFQGIESPVFSTDETVAARLAITHLHGLGHRRIGLASGPAGNIPSERRIDGYLQAMDDLGLGRAEDLIVRHSYSLEGGQHAAKELLALGCTGIVAASDQMAFGVYLEARRAGLTIPGNVSLVGYDDDELLDVVSPPLTTIRTPAARLAQESAQSVLALISGESVPIREMRLTPELHLRESTAPPSTAGLS